MEINIGQQSSDWKNKLHAANMDSLINKLKKSKRLVILGVGSELMQDDKAGSEIALSLEKKYGEKHKKVRIFTAYTCPENFTKAIVDFNPDHVLIIDAADLNLTPGEFTELSIDKITDFSLGTHKLSLVMMIRFLKETIHPEFSVLAIQYKSILFGEKMTKVMRTSVEKISFILSEIIDKL
jgi:hydrogenase 3 maturation protease